MSSTLKCTNCGSNDIDVDPSRGDSVCTACGVVLEENNAVSEVQFEENAMGGSSVIGQFVSADSRGGYGFGFSSRFDYKNSKNLTELKAKHGIVTLCNQLQLNPHHEQMSINFYKMALNRNLTKGHRSAYIRAACVYITCRLEKLPILLIDISDMLSLCCYRLGRVASRLCRELCINLPEADPCLFIIRYGSKLEFGNKTNDVINTASRLVQRMKQDYIHTGRRISGLCGAALLMAARWHNFNRTTGDIVKIVKIHESTLRKRLLEFGDTPSSALTLDEFMQVNLEKAEDPPSFKAAKKKDKERVQKLITEEEDTLLELKRQIEFELDLGNKKRKRSSMSENSNCNSNEEDSCIVEATRASIAKIIEQGALDDSENKESQPIPLGPNYESMDLPKSLFDKATVPINTQTSIPDEEVNFDDIDDAELDQYFLSQEEASKKESLWEEIHAEYLEQQRLKEEREKDEKKPEKKKRTTTRKKHTNTPSSTAFEAMEKFLQEKKFSHKINYDVLKSLPVVTSKNKETPPSEDTSVNKEESLALPIQKDDIFVRPALPRKRLKAAPKTASVAQKKQSSVSSPIKEPQIETPIVSQEADEECDDDYFDDDVPETNETQDYVGYHAMDDYDDLQEEDY